MARDEWLEDNRRNWNDRADVHVDSKLYDLQRYIDEPNHVSSIVKFDRPALGDLDGRTLAHLQCHVGTDTLSLARLGAKATGLDFSDRAIAAARDLSARSGTPAEFVEASVYDAPAALGRTFDVVYTSVGTICWLPDIYRWGEVIGELLADGGLFYIRDGHPAAFIWEQVDGQIVPAYDYFTPQDRPLSWDTNETYTDGDHARIRNTRHHEWNHSLADIVTALARAGLRVEEMREYQGIDWPHVPSCVAEGEQFFLPAPMRSKVPMMFSLSARKG